MSYTTYTALLSRIISEAVTDDTGLYMAELITVTL